VNLIPKPPKQRENRRVRQEIECPQRQRDIFEKPWPLSRTGTRRNHSTVIKGRDLIILEITNLVLTNQYLENINPNRIH